LNHIFRAKKIQKLFSTQFSFAVTMSKVETVWDQQVLLPTAFSPLLSLHWRSKDGPTFEIPKKGRETAKGAAEL
jgi:hypothetical protein